MGSEHHGHHDGAHDVAEVHGKAHGEAHDAKSPHLEKKPDDAHGVDHGAESDEHDEHESLGHMMGAAVGVVAGLILLVGHLFNIRTTRRCREACAE